MLRKDYLRIGSLSAAIALGVVLQGAQHSGAPETEGWAGQIEEIKPVPVDTVTLPQSAEYST
ncbi:hypothetical protein [Leisingera sp. F5]|uniref:hypothetical protein n=1 Tax=Leisingera sp. F5 TaxID=1813816 RepID=UPI000B2A28BA|nr:hypothetical protein [Leisingera sp. F5]